MSIWAGRKGALWRQHDRGDRFAYANNAVSIATLPRRSPAETILKNIFPLTQAGAGNGQSRDARAIAVTPIATNSADVPQWSFSIMRDL
jgi:hypothetical protein